MITTWSILIGCACILFTALLASSFQYVEWDQWALKKSNTNNAVDYTTVYDSGRYCWGPGYSAVTFPKTVTTVYFQDGYEGSLSIFSDGGYQIQIDLTFQYTLTKDKIPQMFLNFGSTYGDQVVSVALSTLKNVAPTFTSAEYYQNRSLISDTFFTALQQGLAQDALVSLISLQVGHVYLDQELINKLLAIQVQMQSNLAAVYAQQATIIRKETNTLSQAIIANGTRIYNSTQSEANLIVSIANSDSFRIVEDARRESLQSLFERLGFTNSTQKLAYIYSTGLASSEATLLVNTQNTFVGVK